MSNFDKPGWYFNNNKDLTNNLFDELCSTKMGMNRRKIAVQLTCSSQASIDDRVLKYLMQVVFYKIDTSKSILRSAYLKMKFDIYPKLWEKFN